MTTETFAVVFSGELSPGANLQSAKQKLAGLFKTDQTKIEPLFNGAQHTLKKNLGLHEAEHYQQALEAAGLKIQLKPEQTLGLSLAPTDIHHEPAKRMLCPKCQHEQAEASSCEACGIVVEKYLARQAENEQSTATPYSTPNARLAQDNDVTGPLKVFSLSGRIGRLRYLARSMAIPLIMAAVCGISFALPSALTLTLISVASLVGIAASISTLVQRLHDIGWSGWLGLLMLVPVIGSILGLIVIFVPGSQGTNSYGPQPPANNTGVVILAFLLPILIFITAVSAAISIPAYQSYIEQANQLH